MTGYHVTTSKKMDRYTDTGAILPPVRFFPTLYTAKEWAKRTGRDLILRIECNESYPLPDHKPARWTPEIIREWVIKNNALPMRSQNSEVAENTKKSGGGSRI